MAKVQTTEQITRPSRYRRHRDDEKPPEPEYTIPTEDAHSLRLPDTAFVQPADPRLRLETIKNWINHTKPVKEPFEHRSNLSTWADSDQDDRLSDTSGLAVSEDVQDEWDKREFDRLYGLVTRKFELSQDIDKSECRKIHEKVKRYKKAFLKGFFEARIKRVESNKWLYDKLHVNAESIKERYRRLMYTSDPLYTTVPEQQDSNQQQQQPTEPSQQDPNQPEKALQETKDTGKESDDDLDSVYSFVPERDNVLLQDINAPPHVRGYGKDKHKKFDDKIKLLYLDSWMPADIQEWLNEKKAKMEDEEEAAKPDPNEKYKNVYVENIQGGPRPQRKVIEDWKYEQITGVSELPAWLGPKHLDAKPELDLENFRKQDVLDGDDEVDSIEAERRVQQPEKENHEDDDKKSQVSKAETELNVQQRLLRQLIQSQSKEYYKLWYNTHDTFNTTPFLEARLQRLLREVLNKREWSVYCSYLKKKHDEEENKKNTAGR